MQKEIHVVKTRVRIEPWEELLKVDVIPLSSDDFILKIVFRDLTVEIEIDRKNLIILAEELWEKSYSL